MSGYPEQSSVEENKDMIESFIHILTQIVDHKLPNEFDYHRVPAPWIQIYLLRILRVLGSSDPLYVAVDIVWIPHGVDVMTWKLPEDRSRE